MNNVQLGIVLLPVHSVLASVAGARAPMGVHLPHLRDVTYQSDAEESAQIAETHDYQDFLSWYLSRAI